MNAARSRSPLALFSLLALTVAAAGFRCPGVDPEAMGDGPQTSDGGGGSDVGGHGEGGTVGTGAGGEGGTIVPEPRLCEAFCELEESCAGSDEESDVNACEEACETLTKTCTAAEAASIREECLDPYDDPVGPTRVCDDTLRFDCFDSWECFREGRCGRLCDALEPSNLPPTGQCPAPSAPFDHAQCVDECVLTLEGCPSSVLVDIDGCADETPYCDAMGCMAEKDSCLFAMSSPEGPYGWGYDTAGAN